MTLRNEATKGMDSLTHQARTTPLPWYVYILECRDRSFYVGVTPDLAEREKKHNAGKASRYTRTRRPVRLLFAEKHPDKSSALKREIEIKSWRRRKKIALLHSTRNILLPVHVPVESPK